MKKREREKERKREKREKERNRETHTHTHTHTERERETWAKPRSSAESESACVVACHEPNQKRSHSVHILYRTHSIVYTFYCLSRTQSKEVTEG